MLENNYCVYKHTSPSNKVYIGITSQKPERRWDYGRGYHQKYFKSAIEKYGWDNFIHEILFMGLSKEEAEQKEIELIAFYKSNQREFGYNLSSGGEHGCISYHHTEDAKARISKAHKGKNVSDESKRKISVGNKGKRHTKEQNENHSKKMKGHTPWNKGKKMSDEYRRKLSEAHKGKQRSEETKDKISKNSSSPQAAELYREYKSNGGSLKWNDFRKALSKGNLTN